MTKEPMRVFISYSWDSEPHKQWVQQLATRLREDGIDALLDHFEVAPGDHLPTFMEKIPTCDFVLIICTPSYKEKSEKREGGVGHESYIISSELFAKQNHRQYIPILRLGDHESSIPIMLSGKAYIDLRNDPMNDREYSMLLGHLRGELPIKPPIGKGSAPATSSPTNKHSEVSQNEWEDMKITGVDLEGVTSPRNDGTRGSALYKIPFFLSRRPPSEWIEIFMATWNHPPRYTTMHRSGIAHIYGDRVILDGTTMEEVRDYHRDTLKLVTDETNGKYREYLRKKQQAEARQRLLKDEHQRNIEKLADEINFDDDQ
jgi:hypothetical protein